MTLLMFNTWTANSLQIVIFWSIFAVDTSSSSIKWKCTQQRYSKYNEETLMFYLYGLNVNYMN